MSRDTTHDEGHEALLERWLADEELSGPEEATLSTCTTCDGLRGDGWLFEQVAR